MPYVFKSSNLFRVYLIFCVALKILLLFGNFNLSTHKKSTVQLCLKVNRQLQYNMNSPINEMKIKMELEQQFNSEDNLKTSQEVNNNSSSVLNNNPTTPTQLSTSNVPQLNQTNNNAINNQSINETNTSTSTNSNLTSNNQAISPPASNTTHQQVTQHQPQQQQNNSSTNSHTSSNSNNQQSTVNYTFEYWSQLMKDSKQLQTFSNLFMHVERLLDEEIGRVRKALFQNNKFENAPIVLPEPEGPMVQKQEKVYVPIHEHPNYNFVGRILGPRGMTAKQLEQETGCKIMIRGKGSMRNKHMEEQNRGKTNWEHLSDDLHVLIIVEDTENRAKLKIERAVEEVKKLLVPVTEGEDELKKKQLMELAIINGTYKDSSTRLLENEQLKLLPQTSPHHTALAAVSQQHLSNLNHLPLTPQLHTHPALRQATALNNSHVSSQSAITHHHTTSHSPATSIGPATPLMMTAARTANTHPLLLGNGNSPGATQALLNQTHINDTSQQALAAAAYLYPHYDLSYAAQLTSGFIEYPTMQTAMAAAVAQQVAEASSGKQRTLTGNVRDHPYQRPSNPS